MKLLNLLMQKEPEEDVEWQLLHEGLSTLLRLLAPITPHITHALWIRLGYGDDILKFCWPKVNVKALQTSTVELIVQVNGKLRAKVTVPTDSDEETIKNAVLNNDKIQSHLGDKTVKKMIIVPERLVNIVV